MKVSNCTASWGAERPTAGDPLHCGLPRGHEGMHEDNDESSGGGSWDDDNPYAEPDAGHAALTLLLIVTVAVVLAACVLTVLRAAGANINL